MAFIPVPLCYHAAIIGYDDGQLVVNDLYFTRAGLPTELETAQCAGNVAGWWSAMVLPNLADTYEFQRVVATDLASQYSFQAASTVGAGPGGVVSEQAPNNVAACISIRTAIRGRSYRGRNYIAGIPNAAIDTNRLQPSFIAAITAAYNPFNINDAVDPLVWVVASRYGLGLPRVDGITTPVTTAYFTDNVVDSQKRRLPGRGA